MFGWEFPPFNSGGLGVACFGLARSLARAGVPLTFVLPTEMPVRHTLLDFLFANVKSLRVKSSLTPYLTSAGYIRRDARYGDTLFDEVARYGEEGSRIASATSCDIIHAHDWLSFPAGVAARRATGKPLVVHVHATEFDRSGGHTMHGEVYHIEREGMHAADAVLAISERVKSIIVERYGIAGEKVSVVHNGVDEDALPNVPPEENKLYELKRRGGKIVLFLGRITLQKGPEYFVRAARRVIEYVPEAFFLVAGSGDMEGRMIREAAELGIADRVLFAGFLRGREAAAAYRAADLYVMPSVSEPFGLTPLESLVCGTPALISKQSGVSEVLSHALKVDFWDIEEMANKIIAVLRHPSLRAELARNGGREARRQRWDIAAQKCLNIYSSLLYT